MLNRYRVVKPYRGFESLRLRHDTSKINNLAAIFGPAITVGLIAARVLKDLDIGQASIKDVRSTDWRPTLACAEGASNG